MRITRLDLIEANWTSYKVPIRSSIKDINQEPQPRKANKRSKDSYKHKKAPTTKCNRGFLINKRRRLPTLPHCIAVPSAQVGLTSLFGMGRGGTPPQ